MSIVKTVDDILKRKQEQNKLRRMFFFLHSFFLIYRVNKKLQTLRHSQTQNDALICGPTRVMGDELSKLRRRRKKQVYALTKGSKLEERNIEGG